MPEIVPTILTADFSQYGEKVRALEGIVPRVHIDIIDGRFAPNQTIALEALKNLETSLKIDLHLMVKDPEEWVNLALELLPDRLIAQVEMADAWEFVNQVIEGGASVGIALDLETPVEKVSEEVYHLVDVVLLLAVKAGSGGQKFDSRVLQKIEKVRKITGELVKIGVDGGLNEENILLCRQAGAEIFYVGSSFWQAEDQSQRYQKLVELIAET